MGIVSANLHCPFYLVLPCLMWPWGVSLTMWNKTMQTSDWYFKDLDMFFSQPLLCYDVVLFCVPNNVKQCNLHWYFKELNVPPLQHCNVMILSCLVSLTMQKKANLDFKDINIFLPTLGFFKELNAPTISCYVMMLPSLSLVSLTWLHVSLPYTLTMPELALWQNIEQQMIIMKISIIISTYIMILFNSLEIWPIWPRQNFSRKKPNS